MLTTTNKRQNTKLILARITTATIINY